MEIILRVMFPPSRSVGFHSTWETDGYLTRMGEAFCLRFSRRWLASCGYGGVIVTELVCWVCIACLHSIFFSVV